MIRSALIAAATAAVLLLPTAAPAVVPPKSCGKKEVRGKTYQVKADQITCRSARRKVKRFVKFGKKPKGYTCKDLTTEKDRVNFHCYDGRKVFFAIRR